MHSWHEATCEPLWWALLCGVLFFSLFALLNPMNWGCQACPAPCLPVSWLPRLSQACWGGGGGQEQGFTTLPRVPLSPLSCLFPEGHSRNPSA